MSGDADVAGTYDDSLKYGEKVQKYTEIKKVITGTELKAKEKGNYIYIGPLKATFNKDNRIYRIKVWNSKGSVDSNKNTNAKKYVEWLDWTGFDFNNPPDDDDEWSSDYKAIPSNEGFCIRIPKNQITGNKEQLKIRCYQEQVIYYNARLVLAGKAIAQAQQIGIFAAKEDKHVGNVTWSTEVTPNNFNLKITKTDKDKTSTKIKNAQFIVKVYSGGSFYTWLEKTGSGWKYSDDGNLSSIHVFKTDVNGEINLSNLKPGYGYKVYEYATTSDYLPIKSQIDAGMTSKVDGVAVNVSYNKTHKAVYCGTIEEGAQGTVDVAVTNVKKKLKLTINKADSEGNPLNGVEFKIKSVTDGKWIGTSPSGGYAYDKSFANAKIFTTTDGTISIEGLDRSKEYYICETKVLSGFYEKAEQVPNGMKAYINGEEYSVIYRTDPKDNPNNVIICAKIIPDHSEKDVNVVVDIENVKPLKITIYKNDKATNAPIDGVKFKINVQDIDTGNHIGWLAINGGTYDYTSDYNNPNAEFTTNGGKIELKNLTPKYKYYIYETAVAPGYVELDKQLGGMTVTRAGKKVTPELKTSGKNGFTGQAIYLCSALASLGSDIEINATNIKEEEKPIKLTIEKKDTSNNPLQGAEFKIRVWNGETEVGWLGNTGTYIYNLEVSNSNTTFTTPVSGKIELDGLNPQYQYELFESKAPSNCVNINEQIEAGMTVVKNGTNITSEIEIKNISVAEGSGEDDSGTTVQMLYCGLVDSNDDPDNEITFNIVNANSKTKIIIDKKLKDTTEGTLEQLEGAGFKIRVYDGYTELGWLAENASGYSYTSSFDDATEYITNVNGTVTIENLKTEYKYSVYETTLPSKCVSMLTQVNGTEKMTVKVNSVPVSSTFLYVTAFDGQQTIRCGEAVQATGSNTELKYEIVNIKSNINMKISKYDETGTIPLNGAEFKIKVYTPEGGYKGMLYSGSSYTYNHSSGSTFKTGEDGVDGIKVLNGLSSDYVYKIYETKVPSNCVSITEQIDAGMKAYVNGASVTPSISTVGGSDAIYCGEVDGSSSESDVTVRVQNVRAKTSIVINKKNNEGQKLQGAGFKISVFNGTTPIGWLAEGGSDYTYNNTDINNGKEWTTGADGKITLTGLELGYTYKVYETKVASKCVSLNEQVSKGMTVTKNGATVTPQLDTTSFGVPVIYCGEATSTITVTHFEFDIKNIKTKINIHIEKKNEEGTKLAGAEFKIKISGTSYWLKKNGSSYIYNNTSGSTFGPTDANGKLDINGLSPDYKYEIYEVKAPNNCMSLSEQIAGGMKVYKTFAGVTTEVTTLSNATVDSKAAVYIGDVESQTSDTQFTLDITNMKEKTSITIKKKNNEGEDVVGAGFKIRVLNDHGGEVGWLGHDGSKYTYTNDLDGAKEWLSARGTEIKIEKLSLDYKYEVYETTIGRQCVTMEEQINGYGPTNVKMTVTRTPGGSITPQLKNISGQQMIYCGEASDTTYNSKFEYEITNVKTRIKMKITKKNDENEFLNNVGFKVKVFEQNASGSWVEKGWLSGSEGSYVYTGSATVYKTTSGELEIKELSSDYKYELYEVDVSSANIKTMPLQDQIDNGLTVLKNGTPVSIKPVSNMIYCGDITSFTSDTDFELVITNIKPKIDIKINKQDETEVYLNGAQFKLKVDGTNKWVAQDASGKYTYNSDYSSAKTWTVDGSLEIKGLTIDHIYELYEVKAPDICLSLDEQLAAGMTVNGKDANAPDGAPSKDSYGIKCGTITYTRGDNRTQNITFNIVNIEEYLDITGKVWIANQGNKTNVYNNTNTGGDAWLYNKPVTVTLRDKDGNIVKDKNNVEQKIVTTTGKYTFNTKITVTTTMLTSKQQKLKDKLNDEGYYIMFEYESDYNESQNSDNVGTISYVATVNPTTTVGGSKAAPKKGGADENVFKNSSVKTYIYKLSQYVTSDNLEAQSHTDPNHRIHKLKNMDMGLVQIEDNYDYSINQFIEDVIVKINGYEYTYTYGIPGDMDYNAAPVVRWANGYAYSRPIYPSDIQWSMGPGGTWKSNGLEVYVKYNIYIKNTMTSNSGSHDSANRQISYNEQKLKISQLVNEFDNSRYELNDTNWSIAGSSDVVKYNPAIPDLGVGNETKVTIQFKVKKDVLIDLLSNGKDERPESSRKPSIARATGKHDYQWKHMVWNVSSGGYGIATANQPECSDKMLKISNLTTMNQEKTAEGIFLDLELGPERELKGFAFEDEKLDSILDATGEALGNGKYDTVENKVQNVKVDLLYENVDINNIQTSDYANIYIYNSTTHICTETTTNDAGSEIRTDSNGNYTIPGITPGKYKVKFTYGDGTYSVVDYKSTIITEDCLKDAFGYDHTPVEDDKEWYKHKSHPSDADNVNYSTAVDNLKTREDFNNSPSLTATMDAYTPKTSIGIENDTDDTVTITKSPTIDYGTRAEISGINLGIINNPIVDINTDKVVTYIKITNTQGNIIAEGNPATQNIPYVSNLDAGAHREPGSAYVKAEINEQELYGSRLEIHYAIIVENLSEINWYEPRPDPSAPPTYYGYYYMFGDNGQDPGEINSDAKEVYYRVDTVYDYIDSSVKRENVSCDDMSRLEILDIGPNRTNASTMTDQALVNEIKDNTPGTGRDYKYIISIQGWRATGIYSNIINNRAGNINAPRTDGKDTYETSDLKVWRYLSAEDDDLLVSNVAQVVNSVKEANSPLIPASGEQDPSPEIIVTVIPPTGADMLTVAIYIIVTAVAGIAIAAGIIIIKKKVLKK